MEQRINSGDLKHYIAIMQDIPGGGYDEDGYPVQPKTEVIRTPKAKITNLSGTTVVKNGTEWENVTTQFIIRYSKQEITTDMYIMYKEHRYDIKYAKNIREENKFIEIQALRSD